MKFLEEQLVGADLYDLENEDIITNLDGKRLENGDRVTLTKE